MQSVGAGDYPQILQYPLCAKTGMADKAEVYRLELLMNQLNISQKTDRLWMRH